MSFQVSSPLHDPPRPSRLPRGWAKRLWADRRGATAVEFGLVCIPFFALLGAIIQTAFMMWAGQDLDYALQKTVRGLFTGQFQAANSGQTNTATLLAALKATMWGSGAAPTATVFDWSGVKIDVRLGTSFAGYTPTTIIDPSTKEWAAGFSTNSACATPDSIVIATAAVKFPVFFGLLNPGLANFADGSKLLQSTAVFRAEPDSSGNASSC